MILTNLYEDSEYIKSAYQQLLTIARRDAILTPCYSKNRHTKDTQRYRNYMSHRKYIGDFEQYKANAWQKRYKFDLNQVPDDAGILLFLNTEELQVLAMCEASSIRRKLITETNAPPSVTLNLTVQAALRHGVTGISWILQGEMPIAYTKYVKDGYVALFDPLYKSRNRSKGYPDSTEVSNVFLPEYLKHYVQLSTQQILNAVSVG